MTIKTTKFIEICFKNFIFKMYFAVRQAKKDFIVTRHKKVTTSNKNNRFEINKKGENVHGLVQC